MTQKHTPGPWQFDPPHDEVNERGSYQGAFYAGDVKICTFGDSEAYYNTCGEPPNTVNARLIAAAPELLEALVGMMELATYSATDDFAEQARAAIAKATGKTK